ncbi:DUF4258 domain-containing protein [Brevibacillus centrosporus]|uniref:DUF4258 domain-containing protein n=1 Tax=Brevibacillus centrosporus TaxID=54910 RepID=UPI001141F99F|nr:DUF4258 domain-containing protein [Brevibacillus centrosporus]MEC2133440.1 DUF4258 domain-containing protein [Brevibacillus centrosporus]
MEAMEITYTECIELFPFFRFLSVPGDNFLDQLIKTCMGQEARCSFLFMKDTSALLVFLVFCCSQKTQKIKSIGGKTMCDVCKNKSESWIKKQERSLPAAEQSLEEFREKFEIRQATLSILTHAQERQVYRSFSLGQIREAVMNGYPIQRSFHTAIRECRIVIMFRYKTAPRTYRPMHCVVRYFQDNPKHWEVVTVYDPRSQAWKWDSTFCQRVCFCKEVK